jgi:hypothetical protein
MIWAGFSSADPFGIAGKRVSRANWKIGGAFGAGGMGSAGERADVMIAANMTIITLET